MSTEEQIFSMYQDIGLGTCNVCTRCIADHSELGIPLSKPVSIWRVGPKFAEDIYKVTFVGKTPRTLNQVPGSQFEDSRSNGKKFFFEKGSAYWAYTREIVRRLYGTPEEGWERVAFTNIIKCGNSEGGDRTTQAMKAHCIDELRVVWREIEALDAKHVIFYTHKLCDDEIHRFRDAGESRDIHDRSYRLWCGRRSILWWSRDFIKDGKVALRFLRTSHPQGKEKEAFVSAIVNWIKGTQIAPELTK